MKTTISLKLILLKMLISKLGILERKANAKILAASNRKWAKNKKIIENF